MSESVFCHACMATTSSEARYSNAGDRVCPACESDFIELTQAPPVVEQPQVPKGFHLHFCKRGLCLTWSHLRVIVQANDATNDRNARRADRRNQGFHRHFTTPGGHNVHLHVVTSMGELPQPLESLLSNAEPAQLTALLNNMQAMNLPFNLPP